MARRARSQGLVGPLIFDKHNSLAHVTLRCCHSDAERGGGICLRMSLGRKIMRLLRIG